MRAGVTETRAHCVRVVVASFFVAEAALRSTQSLDVLVSKQAPGNKGALEKASSAILHSVAILTLLLWSYAA